MTVLFALIPWIVVVGFLFFVIKRSNNQHIDEEDIELNFEDDEEKEIIKVAVSKDKAYWVHENIFYESEVTWEPDFTTAKPIDTMSLSNKEIVELMTILDELKEQEKG